MNLGDHESINNETSDVADKRLTGVSTLYGIDISHYQGDLINELGGAKNLHFAICKASQGTSYVDPDFRSNWRGINEKGLIRGAYHFYVCSDDPIQQAIHFSNQISDIEKTDIAPVLDIEQGSMSSSTDKNKMQADLLSFMQKVQSLTGRKPILYTDYAFAQEFLKLPDFSNYDLWLAEYTGAAKPMTPDLWKTKGYKIWQKKDNYNINATQTDFDIHIGSADELVK